MLCDLLSVLPENYPNIYREKSLEALRDLLQRKYSEVMIICEPYMLSLILLLTNRLCMVKK